jgi:spoIIIJ-associated protein
MTTGRKYFSGNTLEIALMQAARHHGLQPEEVAYRKIEKRHGFLKARKGVVIEVDPDSPGGAPDARPPADATPKPIDTEPAAAAPEVEREPAAAETPEEEPISFELVEHAAAAPEVEETQPTPEPRESEFREEMEPREEGPTEELVEAARRGLDEIMDFAKLDLEVQVSEGEEELEIELSGPDRDRLVEDRGNLLLAIQHLLPRLIRGYTGRSMPCHVDSENFHASREAELEKLAVEAAQEVCERQERRTLPPMNPAERRIIHVTLADNKEIATESQGKGFFKRVTISPAMRRPRGFDRY